MCSSWRLWMHLIMRMCVIQWRMVLFSLRTISERGKEINNNNSLKIGTRKVYTNSLLRRALWMQVNAKRRRNARLEKCAVSRRSSTLMGVICLSFKNCNCYSTRCHYLTLLAIEVPGARWDKACNEESLHLIWIQLFWPQTHIQSRVRVPETQIGCKHCHWFRYRNKTEELFVPRSQIMAATWCFLKASTQHDKGNETKIKFWCMVSFVCKSNVFR